MIPARKNGLRAAQRIHQQSQREAQHEFDRQRGRGEHHRLHAARQNTRSRDNRAKLSNANAPALLVSATFTE